MKKAIVFLLVGMMPLHQAWAVGSAGFSVQLVGTRALGMGNAFVATADDPSAIFFNPAGLTQTSALSLSVGASPLVAPSKYSPKSGASEKAKSTWIVPPNMYIAYPLNNGSWVLGFGLFSPFGLETHWSKTGALRYVATDSELTRLDFNPTVAYRVNDQFSIGAGVIYGISKATLKSQVNNGAPFADGEKGLEGDGNGWGADLGVHFKPAEGHAFGLTYRSEMKVHYEGETSFSGLDGLLGAIFGGPSYKVDTETDIVFPPSVMFGYAYKPGPWIFAIDGEWVGYSSVRNTNFTFSGETDPTRVAVLNTGNPIQRQWQDSWNVGLGTNYTFNDTWQARGGYFYYDRVVPEKTWQPDLAESDRHGFTVGGTFARSNWSVDAAYNLILLNKRSITNDVGSGSINGTYETSAHIYAVNLNYRFGTSQY
jgi:long-chain fatty acid transport protein